MGHTGEGVWRQCDARDAGRHGRHLRNSARPEVMLLQHPKHLSRAAMLQRMQAPEWEDLSQISGSRSVNLEQQPTLSEPPQPH